MLPATTERVSAHTSEAINQRLRRATEERVVDCATRPDAIEHRLQELDQEWDIERALEANAAAIALTGVVLAATVDRRWLALPGVVTAFLLQHALQGWCPPVPVMRRLGVRTATEIAEERYALKALRGDFEAVPDPSGSAHDRARKALDAARRTA